MKKTKQFRRDMGFVSLCEWIFVLITIMLSFLLVESNIFFTYTMNIGTILLLYRAIGFAPFESFGGYRILNWNKVTFAITSTISVIIFVYIIYIL